MTTGRLVRWVAVGVIVAGLSGPLVVPRLTAWRVSWGGSLSLAGLVLDILGAFLLSRNLVMQSADEIASAR